MSEALTLGALEKQLKAAMEILSRAQDEEREASQRASRAREEVNKIQRELSAAMQNLQKAAPWNTAWSNQKENGSTS